MFEFRGDFFNATAVTAIRFEDDEVQIYDGMKFGAMTCMGYAAGLEHVPADKFIVAFTNAFAITNAEIVFATNKSWQELTNRARISGSGSV
jgi:hypothetical protein